MTLRAVVHEKEVMPEAFHNDCFATCTVLLTDPNLDTEHIVPAQQHRKCDRLEKS